MVLTQLPWPQINWASATIIKASILFALTVIAVRWGNGQLKRDLHRVRKFHARYGIVTSIVLVIWWLVTPSGGTPDDLITLWLFTTLGPLWYTVLAAALTLYLVHRLQITVVIYE